jgi:hypothetical protein
MVKYGHLKDVLDRARLSMSNYTATCAASLATLHSNLCSHPLRPAGAPGCNADAAVSLKPRKLRTPILCWRESRRSLCGS